MSSQQKTPLSRGLTQFVEGMMRKEIDKLGRALPCKVESIDDSNTIVTVSFQINNVQMPQVQMPVGMAEYIRLPIQVGCLGVVFPVDTFIGQVTGLGSGQADLERRANLSTLVFFPCGNINNSATDDANAVVVYGPNGVILRDSGSKTVVTLTPAGVDIAAQHNVTVEADTEVQATVGSNSILLNTSEIVLTVGSTTFTANGTSIVMVAGGTTVTIDSTGMHTTAAVATGALTAASIATTGAGSAVIGGTITAADATIAGKTFSTHKHSGVTVGGGNSGPPV